MRSATRLILIATLLLFAMLVLSMGVGSVYISPGQSVALLGDALRGLPAGSEHAERLRTILLTLRLPRSLLMALTGAALAASGCAYQGLFRNPLADPYLIGAASGAGLGAVLSLTARWPASNLSYLAVPLSAFAGAVLAVMLTYRLAKVGQTLPVTNLILAGVAVSSFATALSSFLMINASGELRRALVWLLGGSNMAGWKPVIGQLPYIAVGLTALLAMAFRLNVLQFGDEQASQLGINVSRSRTVIILAATLSTAAAVAFVGLIVPHIARRLWGGDMRRLMPLSLLCGAIFLLAADILARVLMAPQELPVGIITALCGAPFFIFILRQSKNQVW